jgi:hypothetical protein
MGNASYNEYKFHVSHENLSSVLDALTAFYGNTDPFPEGFVDSIYYDSMNQYSYRQCLNGEPVKRKFRIRGYGDGSFNQLHLKEKDIFGVAKLKVKIQPVSAQYMVAPEWHSFVPMENQDVFFQIFGEASLLGPLIPAIRVRYYRYRFRVNDYRITLDTNIEVMSFLNGVAAVACYGVLPTHVLEIKTADPRPHVPLLGLKRLPQISFSKFYLGLNLLMQNGESGVRYG